MVTGEVPSDTVELNDNSDNHDNKDNDTAAQALAELSGRATPSHLNPHTAGARRQGSDAPIAALNCENTTDGG
jgi:hypothetical protein